MRELTQRNYIDSKAAGVSEVLLCEIPLDRFLAIYVG